MTAEDAATTATTTAVRDSISVAGWTLVSRVTGVVRVVSIAAVLGPTYFGNLFQSTNQLPNLAYELLAGSLFASMLVPAIVRHLDVRDHAGAARVVGGFLGAAFIVCVLAGAALVAGSSLLLRFLTFGVADAAVVSEYVRVGQILLPLLLPQVLLYMVVGSAVAVQNASGRFALPAAAPSVENLGIIGVLGVYAWTFGTGTELSAVGLPQLLLLGLGTTAAVGLHALTQWLGARRTGLALAPRLGWGDPEVRHLLAVARPSLGYAGLNALRLLMVLAAASTVPGGVVAVLLAMNFYNLPVALGGRPVAQAVLPRLARHHDRDESQSFRDTLTEGFSLMAFVALPAAVGLVVLSGPLAEAASFGEMASSGGTVLLSAALAGMGAGALGEAGFILFTHASYARRDPRAPVRIMALRTAVSVSGLAAAALLIDSAPALMLAIGLSIAVADLLGAAVLGLVVSRPATRGVGSSVGGFGAPLGRALLAAGVMAAAALAAAAVVNALTGDGAPLVALMAAVLTGLGVYLLVHRLERSPELRLLARAVGRESGG
jgi:putative peptidoglycan lipid II flippase